jgi:hypothetical protein
MRDSKIQPLDQLPERWKEAFREVVSQSDISEPLKAAALAGQLREWTSLLTAVVVRSCTSLGWRAAAKAHSLSILPQIGQEFLGMDVMAFPGSSGPDEQRWVFPTAVFERENSTRDDRVAYSLWKVLCVNAPLRVVFAYRRTWDQANPLVSRLRDEVLDRLTLEQKASIQGETLVVMGSRSEGESFPWGYFKFWHLNDLWRFEKL